MFMIIGADGKEYGPVTAEQIRQWMAENRLTRDMQARRVESEKWLRIGDIAELSATTPPPTSTPPLPNVDGVTASPAPAEATVAPQAALPNPTIPAPASIEFTGEWSEYFRIWIVNVLLTIVTLGIYAAWAKVRRRRYFYSHTRIFGHTFEYLADPVRILYGNLIVAGIFLVLALSQVVSPLLYLGMAILFAIFAPWFIVRALAFNARNTAWRGLRFNFSGQYGGAAAVFLLWPLLVPFTLGFILPYIARKQKEFVLRHHAFGASPFSFAGRTEEFYKIYGVAALFFLPVVILYIAFIAMMVATAATAKQGGHPPVAALGSLAIFLVVAIPLALVGSFYFRARMFNLIWNNTTLVGNRFVATMRARDLFVVHLLNAIVTSATGGLLRPWAVVRLVKFQMDSLKILPAGNIDTFVAASQPPVSAVGDAASDVFNFDIGFGV